MSQHQKGVAAHAATCFLIAGISSPVMRSPMSLVSQCVGDALGVGASSSDGSVEGEPVDDRGAEGRVRERLLAGTLCQAYCGSGCDQLSTGMHGR